MRTILTIGLLLLSILSFGQKENQFSIALYLQPELTYYKNNYAYRTQETYTKSSNNVGVGVFAEYDFNKRFFVEIGVGYISRKLTTRAFLNQSALPPPKQRFTYELVNVKSISMRLLEFPFNIGYRFISHEKLYLFINTGITANFLMNTYYEVAHFSFYQGTYKKNYLQGCTINLGVGADYKLSKKISVTSRIAYSAINLVKDDAYLFSQTEQTISLPYKFWGLLVGVKMNL